MKRETRRGKRGEREESGLMVVNHHLILLQAVDDDCVGKRRDGHFRRMLYAIDTL